MDDDFLQILHKEANVKGIARIGNASLSCLIFLYKYRF